MKTCVTIASCCLSGLNVGVFSVSFLQHKLHLKQWFSLTFMFHLQEWFLSLFPLFIFTVFSNHEAIFCNVTKEELGDWWIYSHTYVLEGDDASGSFFEWTNILSCIQHERMKKNFCVKNGKALWWWTKAAQKCFCLMWHFMLTTNPLDIHTQSMCNLNRNKHNFTNTATRS